MRRMTTAGSPTHAGVSSDLPVLITSVGLDARALAARQPRYDRLETESELATLASLEGAWVCPEGAACFVAARQLRASGWIAAGDEVVVLNTGTGLKYPETVPLREGSVPVLPRDGAVPAP